MTLSVEETSKRAREYMRTYRQEHPERDEGNRVRCLLNLKTLVFSHYSGNGIPKCANCKERRLVCLTIDHINGGGEAHRKRIGKSGGYSFYAWLRDNGYPPEYQVLCMNCQFVKREENRESFGKRGKPHVN